MDEDQPIDVAAQAIRTADRLAGTLDVLSDRLGVLSKYGQRNRHLIWGLAISLVLDIALTVAVALVAVQASHASSQAAQVHAAQVSSCEASNVTRAQTTQLWDHILSLPTVIAPTAAQLKERAQFQTYVHQVFAPRDCTSIAKEVKP